MKSILSLLFCNPKLFFRKVARRASPLVQRIKLFFMKPRMHNFQAYPYHAPQLFDLADAWSLQKLPTAEEVNQILTGQLTFFGHTTTVARSTPRWSDDLRIPENKNPKLSQTFSLFITLKASSNPNLEAQGFDIKYPWERSRLQHLIPLGRLFEQNPEANAHLFTFFKEEILSWADHNPYMYGANWMNAMEVGIRATSLIWLFKFFYTPQTAESEKTFWNTYRNLLMRHAEFIEKNWEHFDTPNNHYLLDLVGAWYLATFFAPYKLFPLGNLENLWETLCSSFDAQLHNDGTSYEGSTSYHKLVIQALKHAQLLGKTHGYRLPPFLEQKLENGILFLADCIINSNQIIQIGDNDSGFLVAPLHLGHLHTLTKNSHTAIPTVREYPDFGCIFIANTNWHISLRTRSFSTQNPRGHFHQDLLGVTVAHQGKPIITDPGTGCYTANTSTRNTLRSWKAHSTFVVQCTKDASLSDLFDISGPMIAAEKPLIAGSPHAPTVTAQYTLQEGRFTRSIKLNTQLNTLVITDSIEPREKHGESITSSLIIDPKWNTTIDFPSSARLQDQTEIIRIEHDIKNGAFECVPAFVSKEYGDVTPSHALVVKASTPYHATIKITPQMQTSES